MTYTMKLTLCFGARDRVYRSSLKYVASCLIFGGALSAVAQSVISSTPAPSAPPAGLQPATADEGATDRAAAPLQWGVVAVRPHAFYRLTRGDGIQFSPGNQTTTTVSMLSAGLLFEIGKHWTADYTPTWTQYSSSAFSNTLDHAVVVNGHASFTDGTLQFVQQYSSTNSPRIETGRQTHEETDLTSLAVNYSLGRKTRLEVVLSQDLRFIEAAPNSYEWSMQDWFHYQVSNRVDAAVGLGLGYVGIEPGTDMDYTRPQVRLGWRPTDKLSFDVHAGAEQRHFRKAGSASLNNPTYGAAGYYQPFEFTSLSLSGERGVSASYFANQVNENTSWSIGLNQRLLQKLNFNATASRTTSRYIASGLSAIITTRDDTSYAYNFRLSTSFLRRGTIGVVYQHTRNSSDAAGFSFSSNQIGLEIGYRY